MFGCVPATLGLSPFEKLYGCVIDYSTLRVFGSTCFVLLPCVERRKLSSCFAICGFLGYDVGQKGYRCYDPVKQKLDCSCHVVFLEHIPFYFIHSFVSRSLKKSYLICIDPFVTNTKSSLSNVEFCKNDTSSPISPDVPFTPMTSKESLVIVDLTSCYPRRDHKSTQLLEFVYSS